MTSGWGGNTRLKSMTRIEKRAAADKYVNTDERKTILREEIAALLMENNSQDAEELTI